MWLSAHSNVVPSENLTRYVSYFTVFPTYYMSFHTTSPSSSRDAIYQFFNENNPMNFLIRFIFAPRNEIQALGYYLLSITLVFII